MSEKPDLEMEIHDSLDRCFQKAIGLRDENEALREALHRILKWADAYPGSIFPPVDSAYLQRAHEVLTAHGMTVDRISADAMRHCLVGVGRIARAALKDAADA